MKSKTRAEKSFSDIKKIIFLFFSTRLVLTVIGIFSRTLLEEKLGKEYTLSRYLWLDIWGVWDTFWYIDIAENGYSEVGRNPLLPDQANYAFFPLYPLLMRIVGTVFGNHYYIAGVIISNICLLLACIFFYKLVRLNYDRKIALNSIKYMLLFPVSFIFSGVFTESLYVLLAILCFYFAQTERWLFAGISGFMLSLTRSLGVLMLIPLLYLYFKRRKFVFKSVDIKVIYLLLIPLGLLLFAGFNYHLTGDFLAFTKIQATWNRSLSNPLFVLVEGLFRGFIKLKMKQLLESSLTLASILLLILFFRKIEFSYWIFGMYSILVPLTTGLVSMPRFILPIFPIYILLSQLTQKRYVDEITTISLGLIQGFLMVFWSCGFALVV